MRSFLRYQLTAYSFADPNLRTQMRDLLSLDHARQSPLLKGPYISLSRPFREGVEIDALVEQGLLHPHLRERIPRDIGHLYSHQERAIRAISEGKTTLVATGTGSGKTECFLYPIISQALKLRDEIAKPGISAVIVYPMNALAEDQLMRLRGLLAGTGIPFGIYTGRTPERRNDVAGDQLPRGSTLATYKKRLARAQCERTGETVYPGEEVCSREAMRSPGGQPRILLTNVKQLELLLTRQQDVELFADARLDYLVFDEAHTFTGAMGAETAVLIRRLRAFCNVDADATRCVATSATIVDQEEPDAARNFAARFFGVPANAVATINEDYEHEVWAAPRTVPPPCAHPTAALDLCVRSVQDDEPDGELIRRAYRSLSQADLPPSDHWQSTLHEALARNEVVFQVNQELAGPRSLTELPAALRQSVDREVTEAEILAWLTLAAAARVESRPLLRPVVHAFVRGISGAVVTFPTSHESARLWLAAEQVDNDEAQRAANFPVTTCTTCGQHYFIAHLKDFRFTGRAPEGGEAGADGTYWQTLPENEGGKRVVLFDRLIGQSDDDDAPPHTRAAPIHICRTCGTAHPEPVTRCRHCGEAAPQVQLWAVKQNKARPGMLSSCLSCGAAGGRRGGGYYREPARPVRAVNVADVHVLTQDMVHHAERQRLLVFCDNRQDAAFQAGWMKDHARRFRLRALMADGIRDGHRAAGDLTAYLDDLMESDETLSRALIPEVWAVARREGVGGRHEQERRKYLRIQVLREVTLSSRQSLGLEPWGRVKVEYDGLNATQPWIQDNAHRLGISPESLREGVSSVLDYLRRQRILHDPEYEVFTRYWMEGDREIQQGYLPSFLSPKGTKLRRASSERPAWVTQWLSEAGVTTLRQIVGKWGATADNAAEVVETLFNFLVEEGLLTPVRLKGARNRPLAGVEGIYQVNADKLRLNPNKGIRRCRTCRRATTRAVPHDRCPARGCDGVLEWEREDEDNYDLQLLDGAYSMLRPEEHTAMVPNEERERLENLFKGSSDAVNCLVCTPTLELGIDIGHLDSVLMRNVPPLPANYWQRAGRAGRRHRMAVDIAYCRPVSHDRAYFAEPTKLLGGRIDPPAFNLRNEVMVAKHVHATVIAELHRLVREEAMPPDLRQDMEDMLRESLPRRVEPYLFENGEIRQTAFDFEPLRNSVAAHVDVLTASVQRVFEQGWPDGDADVVTPKGLRSHVEDFVGELEAVVHRLRRRLRWAMDQIARLNRHRETRGTLAPDEEALFRRCDRLVKQIKSTGRARSQAEGFDDFNTFSVLAAEGFLPGYGLEVGAVVGWAEIPYWQIGGRSFSLPRPPATALREYVPGNLIYANGHKFVARCFHREPGRESAEMPFYEVSVERQAVQETSGESSSFGTVIQTMVTCDADLTHTSHISDEEDLRFQLGVAVYGLEQGRHSGGQAFRWGDAAIHLRRGVRMRLVNVGASSAISADGAFGYPVCTVCGQSVSPLATEAQHTRFRESHQERCGRAPQSIGFHADVVADALSLPGCKDAKTAYSVLEALRIGATSVLDMHMEDLQIIVIGYVDRDEVDGLLWDPMPGGSGLLQRLCERFDEVVATARNVVEECPSRCESSCVDCLQTFRNAYYHKHLFREVAQERLADWGSRLKFDHDIPPLQPSEPADGNALPVNNAEIKLAHLLVAAGFGEGIRGEQIKLGNTLGTTTPDVIYRADGDSPDETVCVYLDGLSQHLHGNPETAAKDREIRLWLRNMGYEVIEIAANELDDRDAMVRHFQRLAGYLGNREQRRTVREDPSWFDTSA